MAHPLTFKAFISWALAMGAGTTGFIYRKNIKIFVEKKFLKTDNSYAENEDHLNDPFLNDDDEDNEMSNFLNGEDDDSVSTYIIVKTSVEPDSGITKDLYETSGNKRNFKCTVDNNDDTECDIFAISDTAANDKLNNLKNIDSSDEKAKKDSIKTNDFFKLKIKNSVFTSGKWDDTKTVDIISTDAASSDKKYGTFVLKYKIIKKNNLFYALGKTDWIIGKMTTDKTSEAISDVTNLSCSTKDAKPDDKASCSIFKIDGTFNNFSDITKTSIKNAVNSQNDFSKDKYFVIDLKKNNQKSVSDFTKKTKVIIATSSDNKKIGEFSFQSALLKVVSGNFSSSSKTVLLS